MVVRRDRGGVVNITNDGQGIEQVESLKYFLVNIFHKFEEDISMQKI